MKSAGELEEILNQLYWDVEHGKIRNGVSRLKQIQLDAMKEGMRRAAKICDNIPLGYRTSGEHTVTEKLMDKTQQAILTTAEQWTEKDL